MNHIKNILSKNIVTAFLCLFLSVLSLPAWAAEPVQMLQTTADQIIAALKAHKADLKSNPKVSYRIVNQYLVPLVDQDTMAQAVVGRNAWQSATSSQRVAFIEQFRKLVVRTYAAAIAEFTDETVKFLPYRGDTSHTPIINIKSKIIRSNAPSISVNYTLAARGTSWKVIDFSVDGVSMVQSFKSQFQPQLSSEGLAGLITRLKAHNQQKG